MLVGYSQDVYKATKTVGGNTMPQKHALLTEELANRDCGAHTRGDKPKGIEMSRQVSGMLYGVAMAAVIVGVDLVFFRNRFWERLMVNIGIVLVFAAFYLRFLRVHN
jgi:hypothetical protein